MSWFHTDPYLTDNYAVALLRPNIMLAVLDITVENALDLAALDLSDNKLYSLDNLSVLSIKLPNLKAIHIKINRMPDMHHLDCLEGLHLEEHAGCKYQDSNLRKRFQKFLKLDRFDPSPLILPDVITKNNNKSYSEEGLSFVCRLLEEHYRLYEQNNRKQLASVYLDNSMFFLTSTYPLDQNTTTTSEIHYGQPESCVCER